MSVNDKSREGGKRRRSGEFVRMSVRVPDGLLARVREWADGRGVSMEAAVDHLLMEGSQNVRRASEFFDSPGGKASSFRVDATVAAHLEEFAKREGVTKSQAFRFSLAMGLLVESSRHRK